MSAATISSLFARPFDQVCVVVANLDEAMEQHLGLGVVESFTTATVDASSLTSLVHRGHASSLRIRVALSRSTPQVELIEPLRGPSVYHEHVERQGYGLHHLGYVVPSVNQAMIDLEASGFPAVYHGTGFGKGGGGAFAYFDLRDQLGYWVEAIQWA